MFSLGLTDISPEARRNEQLSKVSEHRRRVLPRMKRYTLSDSADFVCKQVYINLVYISRERAVLRQAPVPCLDLANLSTNNI